MSYSTKFPLYSSTIKAANLDSQVANVHVPLVSLVLQYTEIQRLLLEVFITGKSSLVQPLQCLSSVQLKHRF